VITAVLIGVGLGLLFIGLLWLVMTWDDRR
jgi:hypothetical protein